MPCPACALAGAFATLGFNEPPLPAPRFSPLDLPSSFRHYRVDREIAAGGMGMVYEAWDTLLGRRIALKMLRRALFATDAERLRFQSEAELGSRLDHPHIVPVHEVGVHEGQPYFTMKLIHGGSLAKDMAAGATAPREAATLMLKIARAVHHAHQRGVIHRDLKPANILLDEWGEPWLTDFGVAKWLETDSCLTNTQTLIGTPDYMSPEQASGRVREISTATDVWALGVMLYQMLTGRLPFQGMNNMEILRQVADLDPPAPSTVLRQLDRDLETLCLRCLEKDPARRLASAGELADELERWLKGDPIRARRITGLERIGKWTRRHPYRTAFLGMFALVLLLAGATVTWQWRRAAANEERALASAATERRVSYSATLAQALAAREHHDFGQARRLLDGIDPALREFDWRLLHSLCRGDDLHSWQLGDSTGTEPQCLAWVPGKPQLAILSADGYLHLRDLNGKAVSPPRALPPLPPNASQVRNYRSLAFSPNGRRLAYACGDVLQVLETESFTLLYEEASRLPQCGWLDDEPAPLWLQWQRGHAALAQGRRLDSELPERLGERRRNPANRLSRNVRAARRFPGSPILRVASRHRRSFVLGTNNPRLSNGRRLQQNPSGALHDAGVGIPRHSHLVRFRQVPCLFRRAGGPTIHPSAGGRPWPGRAGSGISFPRPRAFVPSDGKPPGRRGR
jgi:Protein kinase domain